VVGVVPRDHRQDVSILQAGSPILIEASTAVLPELRARVGGAGFLACGFCGAQRSGDHAIAIRLGLPLWILCCGEGDFARGNGLLYWQ
jgi:hypothetical protein